MSQRTWTRPPPTFREGPSSPLGDVGLGLLPLLAVSFATCWILALPTSLVLLAVAPYAGLGALLLTKLPSSHPGPGLGPANRLTLARATLVLTLAALALLPGVFTGEGYWWIVGLSTSALVLDGLDGPLARRTGTESAFGARFDMELDAFLLLVAVRVALAEREGGILGPARRWAAVLLRARGVVVAVAPRGAAAQLAGEGGLRGAGDRAGDLPGPSDPAGARHRAHGLGPAPPRLLVRGRHLVAGAERPACLEDAVPISDEPTFQALTQGVAPQVAFESRIHRGQGAREGDE